jgi:creatinine amidohydrolase
MPWTEAERVLTPDRVVVLPLGAASKEHGPHLTLGNDQILADYEAARVVAVRPVALLPTLTYGHYPNFVEYPGTVSISSATQKNAVIEICRSIARFGPRRFYVLNTGVSTQPPLQDAATALAREGILMRFTDPLEAGKAGEDPVRQQRWGTHADEIETSMILYMQPASVHMERAVADGERVGPGPLTRDPRLKNRHYSPSGVFGDPTLATWQKGERIVEATIAAILKDIDELALTALPKQR